MGFDQSFVNYLVTDEVLVTNEKEATNLRISQFVENDIEIANLKK